MSARITRVIRRYLTYLPLVVIIACDSFKEDFIQPERQVTFSSTEYYILPGTSVIIDQKSIIKESFTDVSLSVSQNPTRGSLSPLDTFLVKYRPDPGFTEGKDQFVVSVLSKGKVLTTQKMTIFMKQRMDDFPCALYSVEDRVKAKPGSSIAIRVLDNDRLCGTTNTSPQVSIHLSPRYGEGSLEGDSIVVYKPGPAFTGKDEFVYKITDSAASTSSYGIITITNGAIQTLDIPGGARKILFVDEKTGFLLGDNLYRTTDGGENWSRVAYPQEQPFQLADVFFLNDINGFLATSHGPLMHTTDGGTSWSFVDVQNPFDQNIERSVFFTSSSTGFVVTASPVSYDSESIQHHVYKTVDNGMSWKVVFTTLDETFAPLSIVFPNPNTGYAFQGYKIFITTDAGESWKLLFEYDGLFSPVATVEGSLFAILRVEMGTHLVHKSNDGLTWKPVETSMQLAHALAFSPSGDLGLVVGWSSLDEHPHEHPGPVATSQFRLSKSLDQGETWTPVNAELYGIPLAIEIPSGEAAYILFEDKLLKYIP